MYFVKLFTSCVLFAALVGSGYADPSARLAGGQEVDSLNQFPFYVYIKASDNKCGGSILNERWIITSADCVSDSDRLELSFGRKNENDPTAAYFTISVSKDQVYPYPTNFDDLALVKLPLVLDLVSSDSIKPINLSTLAISALSGKFAVLAGFNEDVIEDNLLKYGMFNVLDQSTCKAKHLTEFNEYSKVCAEGWGAGVSCSSDYGSGLVINWPGKSELIGIYSKSAADCSDTLPGVYTYINKYASWINNMIKI